MATTTAYIKEMVNATTSDIVYPVTKSQAVYMEDNSTTVQKAIDDLSALKNVPSLDSQTSPNVSDLLTIFRNTNSTGYKALVSDVAKTIIENYQSSSLAGKTQSVKAALDSLNSSKTSNYFVDVNNESTFQTAINRALKTIGNIETGSSFTFSLRFDGAYYFGMACYSLPGISFGRLFSINNEIVYSFRNNNSDSSATTIELHLVNK